VRSRPAHRIVASGASTLLFNDTGIAHGPVGTRRCRLKTRGRPNGAGTAGYRAVVSRSLSIYLRNHEAAAQAGRDLFGRVAASHRGKSYGVELSALVTEVGQDLDSLHELMTELRTSPDPVMGTVLRIGERLGRLKPNGQLLSRSPLSDLIEIEGLLDAVHAKASGWKALAAADVGTEGSPDLQVLLARAASQVERLSAIHDVVAADVLDQARTP